MPPTCSACVCVGIFERQRTSVYCGTRESHIVGTLPSVVQHSLPHSAQCNNKKPWLSTALSAKRDTELTEISRNRNQESYLETIQWGLSFPTYYGTGSTVIWRDAAEAFHANQAGCVLQVERIIAEVNGCMIDCNRMGTPWAQKTRKINRVARHSARHTIHWFVLRTPKNEFCCIPPPLKYANNSSFKT